MHALDSASLADALARACDAIGAWRGMDVVLAGFIEPTLQQERLIGALIQHGASIRRCSTLADGPVERACTSAESSEDELLLALTWARDAAFANPNETIGIAVEDLSSRRDQAIALAEDVLCPALQLPGREEDVRAYNISLGSRLASTPLAAAALGWIELSVRPLLIAEAAVLLR